ncbi:hypothetical protein [Sphingobacterium pedocola]|uniref:Lipoprotein n=1 Tax=Sphingobacterium pedocola TaxID=2082722 RepID=A0ABR9T689_9SPHI|nr:hypothetical protein [Sphingobacterium pedocola]MBE8720831.1 hypothetical protein [Sphingobacterium pedocola]
MKIFYTICILIISVSCHQDSRETRFNQTEPSNVEKKMLPADKLENPQTDLEDLHDWQQGFGLTHDPDIDSIWFKPVSYYLNDINCADLAKQFYYGKLRPMDNQVTEELLHLVTSNNNKLRPFYRWCLNKTIVIQDGALGEYTGQPARKYAERFPKEFFEYMDIDVTGEKYHMWVAAIGYSGFYRGDDFENPGEVAKDLINTMNGSCRNCSTELLNRIKKIGHDCFMDRQHDTR